MRERARRRAAVSRSRGEMLTHTCANACVCAFSCAGMRVTRRPCVIMSGELIWTLHSGTGYVTDRRTELPWHLLHATRKAANLQRGEKATDRQRERERVRERQNEHTIVVSKLMCGCVSAQIDWRAREREERERERGCVQVDAQAGAKGGGGKERG